MSLKRLMPIAAALALTATLAQAQSARDASWDDVTAAAKGQTVYFKESLSNFFRSPMWMQEI